MCNFKFYNFTNLILLGVVRVDTQVRITLASEMVDPVLFANCLVHARRRARVRQTRIEPHALRADTICDYSIGQTENLVIHFYRFEAALKNWY